MTPWIRLVLLVLAVACGGDIERGTARVPNADSALPSPLRAVDLLMTGTAVAGVRLCDPLSGVNAAHPGARDTVVMGEADSQWPSKVVALSANEHVLFESSWIDTPHVWRITTNSPSFHTRSGLRVGSSLEQVLATGDSVMFEYPEGVLAIALARDSVAFQVDDSSAAAFWRRFAYEGDPLTVLDRAARIKELGIGGDCRGRKQPPN